jgi:hypothetical protein
MICNKKFYLTGKKHFHFSYAINEDQRIYNSKKIKKNKK